MGRTHLREGPSCEDWAGAAGLVSLVSLAAIGAALRIAWTVWRRPVDPEGSSLWIWGLSVLFILAALAVALLIPVATCPSGTSLDPVFRLCIRGSERAPATQWMWAKWAIALGGIGLGIAIGKLPAHRGGLGDRHRAGLGVRAHLAAAGDLRHDALLSANHGRRPTRLAWRSAPFRSHSEEARHDRRPTAGRSDRRRDHHGDGGRRVIVGLAAASLQDTDGTDTSDADGTDGDATDGTDGDAKDADGTDTTDADGTDGDTTDGTDGDATDADGTDQ